ncbi:unnamed protein product [Ceutorhynchus assimilis]|uniref:Uncharacterized protein n=1 Tax=Ceutorhynchus assimilis TaxID=467358 RepID=A0A9N9QGL7_9CUCU|nr:unnamed protein product [Ceutorhynchus assimilis]
MLDSSPEDEDFPGRLLHQSALWDNTELLEDLLEGGQQAFLNSQDSWGRTPIHAAVITENSKCLQLLLNAGADPNVQCGPRGEYKSPLHVCAEYGHYNNIQTLLQHNANIQIKDGSGLTPLNVAEKCGQAKCVEQIKEAADAKEKARLDIHAAIRHACSQGDLNSVQQLLSSLQNDAELLVNMAPSGANTLLFTACETGNRQIVKILLDHGADGRYHSVTKYSPLYIACYQGHREVVEMLLIKFPELVQQHTVERWLPIHAACINGHHSILELLFYFPYPTNLLRKYRDVTEQWEYFMPFDLNERDATGQNILYVASLLGNKKLVEVILKFKIKATRIIQCGSSEDDLTPLSEPVVSPTRRRISDGIMNIMSKLHLAKECPADNEFDGNSKAICPLRIDMYCNNNTETALHAAIKGRHYDITLALLNAGANASAIIKPYHNMNEDVSCCSIDDDPSYSSSGLVEACRNRDVPIVDLLLKRGARDDECKALGVAVANKDETLIAKLLSIKAHPDPEFKINKKAMTENINSSHITMFANVSSLTYSSLFPNTPTMINWHNQKCGLTEIKIQWLIDAALNLNPKLKQNPRSYDIALFSITRLDVSNNSLTYVPLGVFQLQSLKYLNLSQNRIEKLPVPEIPPVKKGLKRKPRKEDLLGYNCPLLEELYLQENRLNQIPEDIFKLPNLVTLVVSNNKLQHLPYELWLAPKLKELNASFNFLKELPTTPLEAKEDFDRMSVSSSDSHLSSLTEPDFENEITEFDKMICNEENIHTVRYQKKKRSYLQLDLNRHHIWSKNVEVTEQILHNDESSLEKCSQLSALNLAHNLFTSIPVVLPCLAVNLTRLNMAFNTLRSMSHITSYPSSLKQLDLSHNQITVWPSLPQVEAQDNMELANLACYMENVAFKGKSAEAGEGILQDPYDMQYYIRYVSTEGTCD